MGLYNTGGYTVFDTFIPGNTAAYGRAGYTGTGGVAQGTSPQATYLNQGGQGGFAGLTAGFDDLEKKAREASGYSDLYANTTLGMVPQATMDAYWDKATNEAYDKSKGAYASMFGNAGYGASGVGPQVEMLSRRSGELATQKARANVENAQRGASTQAQTQSGIATDRYNNYMNLLMAYYAKQMAPTQPTSATGGGGSISAKNPFSDVMKTSPTFTSPWDYLRKPSENLISWGGGYQTSPYEKVSEYNWDADNTPRG